MPTDLTGTPTSLGIGTYNVDADAPSGLGFNEAMAQIDALIASRLATPAGILSGEIPVWNGSTWVRSSALGMSPSGISGYPSDITKTLHGDGSWKTDEIGYDQITAAVNVIGTTLGTATTIITGSAYTFDGNPVMAEFFAPWVKTPSAAIANFTAVVLFESGTAIAQEQHLTPAAASAYSPGLLKLKFSPSAGAHTYSIKAYASNTTGAPQVGAGTGTAGTDAPAYLRFTRASS